MAVKNGMADEALGDLYPFEDKWVELDDGHSMHYIETGRAGLRRPTFLLLHGNPTWSLLYRNFMEPLGRLGRVIAVDHMGFGRSDHPEDPEYYTLEQHIQNLEGFAARLGLKRVVPVLHDWGGPIGCGFATRHPDKIAGLVILNTWAFAREGEMRLPWVFRAMMKKGVGEYLYGKRNLFVERSIPSGTKTRLPKEVMDGYRHPFVNRASRQGIIAFPRMIPTGPEHPDWATLRVIDDALPSLDVPALILWANDGGAFHKGVAHTWHKTLPGASAPIFFDAGHYLQEDIPDELVAHITAWAR